MIKENQVVKIVLMLLFSGLFISCLDSYNPPAISSGERFLVVDGWINSGGGITRFKLSRTRNLASDTSGSAELNAKVSIESKSDEVFNLTEKGDGIYEAYLNIDPNQQYRLHLTTSDEKEYNSDFVEVKRTPQIDSVSWEKISDGVQIYANTHDSEGKTKYYQYEYEEAWNFKSLTYSYYKYVDQKLVNRPDGEQIYNCFNTAKSTIISLATSENLSENVIYKYPLLKVPASASNRLSIKYSILVKQYALTKEGFQYWQNLKKVTESIGTLFDPQPSTFRGNIHCVSDENEMVIGFVSAGNFTEKRLFIDRQAYGYASKVFTGYEACVLDTLKPDSSSPSGFTPSGNVPVDVVRTAGGAQFLLSGTSGCIDCTTKGTTVKPDFWQ